MNPLYCHLVSVICMIVGQTGLWMPFATFLVLKTLLQLASNYVVLRCMYVDHDDTNYI
jgi:hypothetical protein